MIGQKKKCNEKCGRREEKCKILMSGGDEFEEREKERKKEKVQWYKENMRAKRIFFMRQKRGNEKSKKERVGRYIGFSTEQMGKVGC